MDKIHMMKIFSPEIALRRSLIKDLERMKRGEETAELPEPAEEKTKQESAEGKTKQKKKLPSLQFKRKKGKDGEV